jgi:hypothetical protein
MYNMLSISPPSLLPHLSSPHLLLPPLSRIIKTPLPKTCSIQEFMPHITSAFANNKLSKKERYQYAIRQPNERSTAPVLTSKQKK